ncbi:hypothetical protein BGZ95_002276, partial [Linnemannia exigua]
MTQNEFTSDEHIQAVRVCEQGQIISKNDNNNTPSTEVFYLACHSDGTSSGKDIILWDDILAAFSNAVHVRSGAKILPFLKGCNFKKLDSTSGLEDAVLDNYLHIYNPAAVEPLRQYSQTTPDELSENESNSPPPSYADIGTESLVCNEHTCAPGEDTKEPMYSARRGDASAQVKLGDLYRGGEGMEKDYKTALDWYRKAAERGNANGQFKMGYMCNHGYAVQQDYSACREWYLKAAKQGHDIAKNNLGHLYKLGHGVNIDYVQAMDWYRRSADQGLAEAEYNVGSMYHLGQGVPQNFPEAMTWFLKAAEKGVAGAQVSIGYMYQHGQHVPLDFALAITWYHKAIDQDPMVAHFNLGWMYEFGQGVVKDYAKAMELYKKSAYHGDAEAKERYHSLTPPNAQAVRKVYEDDTPFAGTTATFTIFHIACHPDGVSGKDIILWDDIVAAFKDVIHVRSGTLILPFLKGPDFKNLDPFRIAAVPGVTLDVIVKGQRVPTESASQQQGQSRGTHSNRHNAIPDMPQQELRQTPQGGTASSPHQGQHFTMDEQLDTNNYSVPPPSYSDINTSALANDTTEPWRSARLGNKDAQVELGDKYKGGHGIDQDFSKAFQWYLKAASQGHAGAQHNVGEFYRIGQGVPMDYSQAKN